MAKEMGFLSRALLAQIGLVLTLIPPPASAATRSPRIAIALPVVEGNDLRFAHVAFGSARSHDRVSDIVEDNQGFLWFGTQDGVKRYDGYTTRDYRHDPRDSNSLQGSFVLALFRDRSGMLWIASASHYLDRYDPVTNAFVHYRLPTPNCFVSHINQDRDGLIWLATNRGLVRLDPASGQQTRYRQRPNDPTSLSSDDTSYTYETRDGSFWVANDRDLEIFDRHTAKVVERFPMVGLFPAGQPGAIRLFEDHAGVLWVCYSSGNGLASVDRRQKKLVQYTFSQVTERYSLFTGIRSIYEDRDGDLWLGTNADGLLRLDRGRTQLTRYRNNPNDPDSLSADRVDAIFEDHEGDLWIGTTGGGLNRTPRRPLPFRRYGREPGSTTPLTTVSTVFEDSKGILWVGSRGTLYKIDRASGKFSFFRNTGGPRNLSSNYVLSIVEDETGLLWFGTWGGGLDRFNRSTGEFTVYRHDPLNRTSLNSNTIWTLFVDRKGTLWAGGDGLSRFEPKAQTFRNFEPTAEPGGYRAIAQTDDGAIWAGSWGGGLLHLDPETGTSVFYRHIDDKASLSSNEVNAICVDRSGTIWVGTESGLNRFDPATRTFKSYFERDGLPNSDVTGILQDDRGYLWISTSNGLSKLDIPNQTFSNYYASDGLWVSEFFGAKAAWKSPRGEMFFCSYTGLTSFFPDQVKENPYVPPVVLTEFHLFGKPVTTGRKPLSNSITVTKEIDLTYAQNFFSFNFAALSFQNPGRNRYRYKLERLEKDWNETDSSQRTATYTAIPPGDYVFRVIGSNNRGIWNAAGASVRIRILPAWWATTWFRVVATAFVLALLWAAYYLRVSAIERRNRELQRAERQISALNERLINAHEEERTRIARELHDDFSQQIAGLGISLSNLKQRLPARDLEARDQAEKLQNGVRALAEGVRLLSHSLHPSVLEYVGIAQALKGYCSEFTSLTGVNVSYISDGSFDGLQHTVSLCLYRVTQEALQNVAKHANTTQADVTLIRRDGSVSVSIKDYGAGCSPDLEGSTAGLGLISMRERARLLHGTFRFDSHPDRGTTVEVEVPVAENVVA